MAALAPLVTLPNMLAAATAVVGAGSAIMSGIQQSEAQKSQAQSYQQQAYASQYNAQVARQQADAIRAAGALEQEKERKKGLLLMGQQEAAFGKSGVVMEGTPLDVMAETAANLEFDRLIRQYNIDTQANRTESEARQYDFMGQRQIGMASQTKAGAGMPLIGAGLTAGTSILTGLTNIMSSNSLKLDYGKTAKADGLYTPFKY